jgi:cytochrome c oxidase subunit 2
MFKGSASVIGKETDVAFFIVTGISVVLFAVIIALMVYFLLKYRRSKNAVPEDIEGNTPLELSFLAASVALVVFMFFVGLGGYTTLMEKTPEDSLAIKAHAAQWLWTFEYPGGEKSNVLKVPLGRPVKVLLDSNDVIHGFYIPAFRVKMDAVPGSVKTTWFEANEAGTYDLFCTQYCGLGHSMMITRVEVMPQEKFEEWVKTAGVKKEAAPGPVDLVSRGKELYQSKGCAACHSTDGSTLVGPSWKGMYGSKVTVTTGGKQREVVADDDYIRRSEMEPNADIVAGFPPVMPPQKGVLSEDDVKALIEYMKTLK